MSAWISDRKAYTISLLTRNLDFLDKKLHNILTRSLDVNRGIPAILYSYSYVRLDL